ncbi:HNH endonuclease signature motif containing protein [Corynebacterium spheniscorum]|uniref:HNH endonuclease signature motif containing protein n=1 Tax=Corynebacterium spheniscorum TaxID=185761 RepID=UPI00123918A6|nr:HNH endonuclease signature motif containing protein [Corynebacterium spheniscorum]KAA8724291.1 HNH endonuclease [Corynebacterium spheniscorum]
MADTCTQPKVIDTPFWANTHPDDPVCHMTVRINKEIYSTLKKVLPKGTDNYETSITRLAARLGKTTYKVEQAFKGVGVMWILPNLEKQLLHLGHLDLEYLAAIFRNLQDVPDELLPDFDHLLVDFFTPTHPNQLLPSLTELREFIKQHKKARIKGFGEETTAMINRFLAFRTQDNGLCDMTGAMTQEEATLIQTVIDKLVKRDHTDRVTALINLITKKVDVKAILNYWAPGPDQQPTYLDGAGQLVAIENTVYDKLETIFKDLTGIEATRLAGYTPNDAQKTYVKLRDGHCRYPGCHIPAYRCEVDHVFEHNQGGQTIVTNLQCLCKKHHNLKTSRKYRVFMDHNGKCFFHWNTPDTTNNPHITLPTGPIATITNTTWATTWNTITDRPTTIKETEKLLQQRQQQTQQQAQQAKQHARQAIQDTTPPTPTPKPKPPKPKEKPRPPIYPDDDYHVTITNYRTATVQAPSRLPNGALKFPKRPQMSRKEKKALKNSVMPHRPRPNRWDTPTKHTEIFPHNPLSPEDQQLIKEHYKTQAEIKRSIRKLTNHTNNPNQPPPF